MQVPVHMSWCKIHPLLFGVLHGFVLRSIDFCCSQVALYIYSPNGSGLFVPAQGVYCSSGVFAVNAD